MYCPNAIVDFSNECDDGNSAENDGCSLCKVDLGYECKEANSLAASICTPICGDGRVVKDKENCDHGNGYKGCKDGCSSGPKEFWECTDGDINTPSICKRIVVAEVYCESQS